MLFSTAKKTVMMLTAALLLLIIGCSSKLTTENYGKLKMGMPYNEVVALLGAADECSGAIGLKNCIWGDAAKHIKVQFAGDKVVFFSGKGL